MHLLIFGGLVLESYTPSVCMAARIPQSMLPSRAAPPTGRPHDCIPAHDLTRRSCSNLNKRFLTTHPTRTNSPDPGRILAAAVSIRRSRAPLSSKGPHMFDDRHPKSSLNHQMRFPSPAVACCAQAANQGQKITETASLILLTLAWLTIVIVTIVMCEHLHPLHVRWLP